MTVKDIFNRKQKERKRISVLTAYDYPFAKLVDEAGVDIVLVGDSLGMVCLGYSSTVPVTMREMLHHVKAVSRAVKHALIVADMPFGSYQNPDAALRNARRFLKEGGAHAVKLEGGKRILSEVKTLIRAGVPVMGHVGMTPQTAVQLGGYKVQGRGKKEADQILGDAKVLEEAGVFSVVLECVPNSLARRITKSLRIPTIGIGAGPNTDGQVLVLHDLLGFETSVRPRFVRRYTQLSQVIRKAVEQYRDDVVSGKFPRLEESFGG